VVGLAVRDADLEREGNGVTDAVTVREDDGQGVRGTTENGADTVLDADRDEDPPAVPVLELVRESVRLLDPDREREAMDADIDRLPRDWERVADNVRLTLLEGVLGAWDTAAPIEALRDPDRVTEVLLEAERDREAPNGAEGTAVPRDALLDADLLLEDPLEFERDRVTERVVVVAISSTAVAGVAMEVLFKELEELGEADQECASSAVPDWARSPRARYQETAASHTPWAGPAHRYAPSGPPHAAAEHTPSPGALYWPVGHRTAVALVEPAGQAYPAAHRPLHPGTVNPGTAPYAPTGHSVHIPAPPQL
jgi:hypothetical protein